jgi:hypothetical protein
LNLSSDGAESYASQKLHDFGIGAGFDREVFLKVRRPGKRAKKSARVFPDAALLIEMKRRGMLFDDFFDIRFGERRYLFDHDCANL